MYVLGNDVVVSRLDGVGLVVFGLNELILEFGDGFDSFVGESDQTSVEGLLLGQERLNRGKVTSVVVRSDLSLFVWKRGRKRRWR